MGCFCRLLVAAAVVVAVLAMPLMWAWSADQPAAADTAPFLQQAKQLYQRHSYKLALDPLEKYLADPATPAGKKEAQRLKLSCLIQLNQLPEARKLFEQLINDYSGKEQGQLYRLMGDAEGRTGNRVEAIKNLKKAVELFLAAKDKPLAADTLFALAEQYMNHYQFDQTEKEVAKQPTTWQEYNELRKKYVLATYDRIVELNVNDDTTARAIFEKARYLMGQGYGAEPQAAQQKAQVEAPEFPGAQALNVDDALVLFRLVRDKYPKTKYAPESAFLVGQILEQRSEFVEALAEYQVVIDRFAGNDWAKRSARQVANIKAPQLAIGVAGPVLPGEPVELQWSVRNVKEVRLMAWKVELFDVVRQGGWNLDLSKLPLAEDASLARWTFTTPDKGEHQAHHSGQQPNAAVRAPADLGKSGAYLVRAAGRNPDGKTIQATTLVLVSKLAAVAKDGRNEGLVFCADAASGKGRGGTKVLVQEYVGYRNREPIVRYHEGAADDAGLFEFSPQMKEQGRNYKLFVRDGEDYAAAGNQYYWWWWGYGGPAKVYGFTDRPVYRPDQVVGFKQILRRNDQGQYTNLPNAKVTIEVYDPRGEKIYAKDHVTDEFGATSGSFKLSGNAPLGVYRIVVKHGRNEYHVYQSQGNQFRVEEYKKPEFEVKVVAAKASYRFGDTIAVDLRADYYFGEPVANAKVTYSVFKEADYRVYERPRPYPWYWESYVDSNWELRRTYRPWQYYGRQRDLVTKGEGVTDAQGKLSIELKAEPFTNRPDQDFKFVIDAEVTDPSRRTIAGHGDVRVTKDPFFIHVDAERHMYKPADQVQVNVKSEGPNGDPVAFAGRVEVFRVEYETAKNEAGEEYQKEKLGLRIVQDDLTTNAQGRAVYKFVTDAEGYFKVIVTAPVEAGAGDGPARALSVTGETYVWVAQRSDQFAHYKYQDLELVCDKDQYVPGDTVRVLINTRHAGGTVLLTEEADRLIGHRVVFVKGKSAVVELKLGERHAPNFTLAAALVRGNDIYFAKKDLIVPPVEKFLTVALTNKQTEFLPGEQAELTFKITDSAGKPVATDLAVMLCDKALYYIQPEFREQVQKFFYGQLRPHNVRTTSNYAFSHQGDGRRRGGEGGGGWLGGENRERAAADGARPGVAAPMSAAPPAPSEASTAGRAMAKGLTEDRSEQQQGQGQDKRAALAEARVRGDFRDSVVWAAHLRSDENGVAKVTAKMPDTLTAWRLHAVAADKQTRVGEAAADLVTRKNVIVRLNAPRFFVEGDVAWLAVQAHNYLKEAKKVRVTLKVAGPAVLTAAIPPTGGRVEAGPDGRGVLAVDIEVPADGERRVDFPAAVSGPGEIKLIAMAQTDAESDAMELTVPALEWGAEKLVAQGGSIRPDSLANNLLFSFEVPKQIRADSQQLTVQISPSVAMVMLEAAPYLIGYPYGCVEQTMSRFLPAVVVRRALNKAGINLGDVRRIVEQAAETDPAVKRRWEHVRRNPVYDEKVLNQVIAAGVKRLASMQHADGGWGWWTSDGSNPYMSAYVVYGLAEARAADVALPEGMIDRGAAFLARRVVSTENAARWTWVRDDDNVRAWMLMALSMAQPKAIDGDKKVGETLTGVFERRDKLTDYGRALLAITLANAGRDKDAAIVVENFSNTAAEDKEKQTVSWGQQNNWWYWYNGSLETTAWVLRAILRIEPKSPYAPMAVNWLVRNRRGVRWYSTKDTAMAVYALADYLRATDELNPDMTVTVQVDGQAARRVRITRENLFSFESQLVVGSESLPAGRHAVRVVKEGKGNLYFDAFLTYFTKEDPITASGHQMTVARTYYKVTPEKVKRTRKVWNEAKHMAIDEEYEEIVDRKVKLAEGDALISGDVVEVQLVLKLDNNFEYMMFEDPKPAGCEPVELRSGASYGGGVYANMELRDQKVAFFATYINQGEHTLAYKLRCEIPGKFRVLPANGGAMYSPWVRAISDSARMTIVAEKE